MAELNNTRKWEISALATMYLFATIQVLGTTNLKTLLFVYFIITRLSMEL